MKLIVYLIELLSTSDIHILLHVDTNDSHINYIVVSGFKIYWACRSDLYRVPGRQVQLYYFNLHLLESVTNTNKNRHVVKNKCHFIK